MKRKTVIGILIFLIIGTMTLLVGCSKNHALSVEKKNQPIEHLVFMTDPGKEQQWIDLDHQYWTEFLANNSGFSKKEVWLNPDNPGEIHTLIWWNSMDEWKQFSPEDVTKNDEKFSAALGTQKSIYTDMNTIDSKDQLYRVRETIKKANGELEISNFENPQPIEHLVFMTDPGKEQQWIDLDHQYWTEFLADNSGFLEKEVWSNPDNPGEIHSLIWWNSMDEWKQFSPEDVTKNDEKFSAALGAQKSIYTDKKEIDSHAQLYATQNTKKVLK